MQFHSLPGAPYLTCCGQVEGGDFVPLRPRAPMTVLIMATRQILAPIFGGASSGLALVAAFLVLRFIASDEGLACAERIESSVGVTKKEQQQQLPHRPESLQRDLAPLPDRPKSRQRDLAPYV